MQTWASLVHTNAIPWLNIWQESIYRTCDIQHAICIQVQETGSKVKCNECTTQHQFSTIDLYKNNENQSYSKLHV